MSLNYAAARQNMVESQIRPNRVTDPALLDALETLPREDFVASSQQAFAYCEGEVSVGTGKMERYLLSPMIIARMIEALNLTKDDKVLDVGCTTGYSTALISHLAGIVIGLESDAQMAQQANLNIQKLGLDRGVTIQHGALSLGTKDLAPFTAIILNGAVQEVPAALFSQLDEGGQLIAIVGGQKDRKLGQVILYEKHHGTVSQRVLFEAAASYLPGCAPVEEFSF